MKGKNKKYTDIHGKLIDKCKEGNQKAQFEIYKLYYHAMYNTSFRIVNNSQEAEDIMQESFLKAFQNLDRFTREVSFGAWLKKIVINQSLDYIRKQKRLFENLDNLDGEVFSSEYENDKEDTELRINQVREEIRKLPEGYRIVLSLYLLEGYDHDEIAQVLDISPSTSRSQYTRARKKLIENLKKK